MLIASVFQGCAGESRATPGVQDVALDRDLLFQQPCGYFRGLIVPVPEVLIVISGPVIVISFDLLLAVWFCTQLIDSTAFG